MVAYPLCSLPNQTRLELFERAILSYHIFDICCTSRSLVTDKHVTELAREVLRLVDQVYAFILRCFISWCNCPSISYYWHQSMFCGVLSDNSFLFWLTNLSRPLSLLLSFTSLSKPVLCLLRKIQSKKQVETGYAAPSKLLPCSYSLKL